MAAFPDGKLKDFLLRRGRRRKYQKARTRYRPWPQKISEVSISGLFRLLFGSDHSRLRAGGKQRDQGAVRPAHRDSA